MHVIEEGFQKWCKVRLHCKKKIIQKTIRHYSQRCHTGDNSAQIAYHCINASYASWGKNRFYTLKMLCK